MTLALLEAGGFFNPADIRVFGDAGRTRLLAGPEPEIAIQSMVDTYREIPAALMPHWSKIGECLLAEGPVLINCTAGKDRTGVAVAVLLEMLGVSRKTIMQDYLQSNIYGENLRRGGGLEAALRQTLGFLPSEGQVDALIGVRAEYLHAAWHQIERGSRHVTTYLADAGLGLATQNEIKKRMIERSNQLKAQGEST